MTPMSSEKFYEDIGDLDSTEWQTIDNGMYHCQLKAGDSEDWEMEGPLHVDICQQDRLIPDDVSLNLVTSQFRWF